MTFKVRNQGFRAKGFKYITDINSTLDSGLNTLKHFIIFYCIIQIKQTKIMLTISHSKKIIKYEPFKFFR